jgi:hypothetical protein
MMMNDKWKLNMAAFSFLHMRCVKILEIKFKQRYTKRMVNHFALYTTIFAACTPCMDSMKVAMAMANRKMRSPNDIIFIENTYLVIFSMLNFGTKINNA